MIRYIPVPRVLARPQATGGAPVTTALPLSMLRNVHRGSGLVGTRGYHRVPHRVGTVMPMSDTVVGGVMATLNGFPYSDDEVAFALGGYMRAGSMRLGGEVTDPVALATSNLGKPKQSGEYYSSAGLVWGGGPVTRRACEISQLGAKGACKKFGFPWGKPSGPVAPTDDSESQLIKTATQAIDSFVSRVKNGQIDPDTAEPAGSMSIPTPTNSANQGLYDTYLAARNKISSARLQGRMMWSLLNPPAAPSGGTTGTTTNGGSTGTTTPSATGTTTVPVIGVGPSPTGGGIYGEDVGPGGSAVLTQTDRPGTSIVSMGPTKNGQDRTSGDAGTPTVAPVAKRSAAIGLGVLALGGILLLWSRKRKRKPASALSAS